MNRIQFSILTALSVLVVLLMLAQVVLGRFTGEDQSRNMAVQQYITEGQSSEAMVKQLAIRIFSDSQKNPQDPALKQLLDRQQITYNPNGGEGKEPKVPKEPNGTENSYPAPSPTR